MGASTADLVFRGLHAALHAIFTFLELLLALYFVIRSKLSEKFHHHKQSVVSSTKKRISHLSVILGREEPSPPDLANIVLWCLEAQIPYLSFFDSQGFLRSQAADLRRILDEQKQTLDSVIWHDEKTRNGMKPKNGFVGRKIHVKLLSDFCDGKRGVAAVTRKLATAEEKQPDSFTLRAVEEVLQEQFEFPDPDLAVCVGKNYELLGYPPWQLRVTEFATVDSHRRISKDMFGEALAKYDKCEQRFGR